MNHNVEISLENPTALLPRQSFQWPCPGELLIMHERGSCAQAAVHLSTYIIWVTRTCVYKHMLVYLHMYTYTKPILIYSNITCIYDFTYIKLGIRSILTP